MKHIYLEDTQFAKEARGYFIDYLKLQTTLCTAAILVAVSLYKDLKRDVDFEYLFIALSLFVVSIVLTVLTKSAFIAYIAEHKRAHVPILVAAKILYLFSFIAFLAGLLSLVSMLKQVNF